MKKLRNAIFISITIIIAAIFFFQYGKDKGIYYGDSLGYYMYLPATFIYHNLEHIDQIPKSPTHKSVDRYTDEMKTGSVHSAKGNVINQYTYGVALTELPFFLIAHTYEKMNGMPADGYSDTYNLWVCISSMFYCLLGLLVVFKILRISFSHFQSLIVTLLIFLGTNLFWFSIIQAGMSHVPLFFLYALLVYLTIRVHEHPKVISFILIGLVMGLITIIRPTDIVCILIPLLYNIYSREALRNKVVFIKTHWVKLIWLIVAFMIPIIPQLLYWKMLSGHFIIYSYGDQTFYWKHPKIIEGLFDGKNGWLVYSPIMIFSLIGMFFYRRVKKWAWCLWVLFPLYCYIIYSWYCYTYINGLGSRPMIHLYPLLAIPFAAVMQWLSEKRVYVKAIFTAILLFFVAVNLSFSIQQRENYIFSEESNLTYDLQVLFRTHLNYNDLVCRDLGLRQPDTTRLVKVATLACEHYDDSGSEHYVKDKWFGSKYVYETKDEEHNPKTIRIKYDHNLFRAGNWLKCSGKFMYPDPPPYNKHLLVLSIDRGGNYKLWKGCTIENKIPFSDSDIAGRKVQLQQFETGKWATVYYFIKIPKDVKDGDTITLDMWNIGKSDIFMDDICLELYRDKD